MCTWAPNVRTFTWVPNMCTWAPNVHLLGLLICVPGLPMCIPGLIVCEPQLLDIGQGVVHSAIVMQ